MIQFRKLINLYINHSSNDLKRDVKWEEKQKRERAGLRFKAKLVLLFMYANDTTIVKDFKPADHLTSKLMIHRTSVGIGKGKEYVQ